MRIIGRPDPPSWPRHREERAYAEAMGRPHANLPPDHPDVWQWEYQGSKAERDGLLERLEPDERGPQPEQDESLF